MKYAFLSDIHSNLVALQAVLNDLSGRADRIFVLGDIVGYGPQPSEVLEWVRSNAAASVQGNHDYAVGTGDTAWLNTAAAFAAEWTRKMLSFEQLNYLASLPHKHRFEVDDQKFLLVHGSPDDPLHEYVFPQTHESLFDHYLNKERVSVLAMGHTHYPFSSNTEKGTVFNPGSVGQPRDGDPRASYAIVEVSSGGIRVENRRVEYDIKQTADLIYKAGLPRKFGDRLFQGV
ncbi:MAG: metallophosphoesterase family protein [Conexivisphaerales archaeon]